MSKCVLCGKKGLFLHIDDHGLCKECAATRMKQKTMEERRIQQVSAYDSYLNSIPRYLIGFENGTDIKGKSYTNIKVSNITTQSIRLRCGRIRFNSYRNPNASSTIHITHSRSPSFCIFCQDISLRLQRLFRLFFPSLYIL